MVRLVFRPYTQIRRTICTSVSLRASIRVSPDFPLFKYSSPSFGSQHVCSYSNLPKVRSVDSAKMSLNKSSYLSCIHNLHLHYASEFSTQILAYMSDSLVRVSRRAGENHFVNISNLQIDIHKR